MEFDGMDRNAEPAGDHLVRSTFGKQRQHLRFARRKMYPQANSGFIRTVDRSAP